jgi:hypothetical protein
MGKPGLTGDGQPLTDAKPSFRRGRSGLGTIHASDRRDVDKLPLRCGGPTLPLTSPDELPVSGRDVDST